ncbi:MAG: alpha/beta fold hydrolase [Candidatus Dormibacteraeota bacterium]|nr:alpha/beta fold hydrolase [Candidatus Dormibacteraeota bacterium]
MADREHVVETADGARLAVTETGAGDTLLLIPGLGATRSVFDPIAPYLARRRRVVVFDPRGVGESTTGRSPLTMSVMAGDAAAVIAALADGRCDVLGASMGGVVAQQLAVDSPDSVRRLVLAATSPGGIKAVPADQRATDALLGKGARTPADAYRLATTVLYSAHFQRTHPEFIEDQVRIRAEHPVKARVFTAQLEAMRSGEDLGARLGEIGAATLVLHGTADAVTPFENARILATRIRGARSRWFQDCGHLLFHERPEESARVVEEFLRD